MNRLNSEWSFGAGKINKSTTTRDCSSIKWNIIIVIMWKKFKGNYAYNPLIR